MKMEIEKEQERLTLHDLHQAAIKFAVERLGRSVIDELDRDVLIQIIKTLLAG